MKTFFSSVIIILILITFYLCCAVVLLGENCKRVRILLQALLPHSKPVHPVVMDIVVNLPHLTQHSVFNLTLASFDWVFFGVLFFWAGCGLLHVIIMPNFLCGYFALAV